MNISDSRLSLDEVLDKFFYSSDTPDSQKLQQVLDAYPEYRQDIVEFVALWAFYENSSDLVEKFRPSMVPDESVSKLQSFVMNHLHDLNRAAEKDAADDLGLAREAISKLAGNALRRAADAAGLFGSSVLLQKVLTNGIRDVPLRVLVALADHLQVSADALRNVLGEKTMVVSRSYKASDKPIVPQPETWANAVKALPLNEEQKKALLELQDLD